MENIFHRVSVRKYQDRTVEPEKVEQILRAACAAPSAVNQQPWEFYVVTDKGKLEELSGAHDYAKCTAKAPLAIVSCYRKNCVMPEFAPTDLAIATEHILLEADALGLGAVWLGIYPIEERMERVEKALSIPENLRAFALVPVGYPLKEKKQEDRFRPERIHYVG